MSHQRIEIQSCPECQFISDQDNCPLCSQESLNYLDLLQNSYNSLQTPIQQFIRRNHQGSVTDSEQDQNIMEDIIQDMRFNQQKVDNQTCPICIQDILLNQDILETPCKHIFHFGCVYSWLTIKNSCPICREIVY